MPSCSSTDVLLMVQVKAQHGRQDPTSWATEKILEAFAQLCKTHKNLVQGHIKKVKNDFYGEMAFDVARYPNRIGLIILAHKSAPYCAAELAPEILTAAFPVHVFSLDDFAMLASRFDTAADLIVFLELRGDIATREKFFVQQEAGNIERMIPHVEEVLKAHMSATTDEILKKSVRSIAATATGKVLESPDWRHGLAIDDIIARVHDIDPELECNKGNPQAKRSSLAVFQLALKGPPHTIGKKGHIEV